MPDLTNEFRRVPRCAGAARVGWGRPSRCLAAAATLRTRPPLQTGRPPRPAFANPRLGQVWACMPAQQRTGARLVGSCRCQPGANLFGMRLLLLIVLAAACVQSPEPTAPRAEPLTVEQVRAPRDTRTQAIAGLVTSRE